MFTSPLLRTPFAVLTLAFVLAGAPMAGHAAVVQDVVDHPGMGLSEAEPEGLPFELPEGLTLENPILGYNPSSPDDCDNKYADQKVGNGGQIRLCLVFNNSTDQPITLQLPPGLIFVSRSRLVQNGMIAQRIFIEVPAKTRYFQPLYAYCLNSGRESSGLTDPFDIGKVTTLPTFEALFRMLEDKAITDENYVAVHLAIGALADQEELSPEVIADINAFPPLAAPGYIQ